jgi:hypothetical protein
VEKELDVKEGSCSGGTCDTQNSAECMDDAWCICPYGVVLSVLNYDQGEHCNTHLRCSRG